MKYTQHPLSAAFPAMSGEEFNALVADIREHGQRDPIIVLDGQVLDGWHRHQACHKAGASPLIEQYDGNDPRAFVLSRNLHRRNLTASQRAAAVVACGEWRPAGYNVAAAATLSPTNEQLAQEAQVSPRTIRNAKAATKAGLNKPVAEGKITAERGAEIAKLPKSQRKAAIADPTIKTQQPQPAAPPASEPEKPVPAEVKPEPPKQDDSTLAVELAELKEQYADLQQINERLEAMAGGEEETAKLVTDLQKRLARCQAFVKTVESQRDMAKNEANQLKAEVKRLRREIESCKK